jgi:hypothetical protein
MSELLKIPKIAIEEQTKKLTLNCYLRALIVLFRVWKTKVGIIE